MLVDIPRPNSCHWRGFLQGWNKGLSSSGVCREVSSLHRWRCPLASHHQSTNLAYPYLAVLPSLGGLCRRSPRTIPVALLCVGFAQTAHPAQTTAHKARTAPHYQHSTTGTQHSVNSASSTRNNRHSTASATHTTKQPPGNKNRTKDTKNNTPGTTGATCFQRTKQQRQHGQQNQRQAPL